VRALRAQVYALNAHGISAGIEIAIACLAGGGASGGLATDAFAARARGTSRVMVVSAASQVKTFDALEGAP
jgi:hypothetical protein